MSRPIALKLGYVRLVPVTVLETRTSMLLVPKNASSAGMTPPEAQLWPDGYSGWLTTSNGCHSLTGSVAALPSVSARWIAWTGRRTRSGTSPPDRRSANPHSRRMPPLRSRAVSRIHRVLSRSPARGSVRFHWRGVPRPEQGRFRLLWRTHRARRSSERLDLVEVRCVFVARERCRRPGKERSRRRFRRHRPGARLASLDRA